MERKERRKGAPKAGRKDEEDWKERRKDGEDRQE
jgi:hypothetical protein